MLALHLLQSALVHVNTLLMQLGPDRRREERGNPVSYGGYREHERLDVCPAGERIEG